MNTQIWDKVELSYPTCVQFTPEGKNAKGSGRPERMKNQNNGKIRVSDPHFYIFSLLGLLIIKNPTAKESLRCNEWELVSVGQSVWSRGFLIVVEAQMKYRIEKSQKIHTFFYCHIICSTFSIPLHLTEPLCSVLFSSYLQVFLLFAEQQKLSYASLQERGAGWSQNKTSAKKHWPLRIYVLLFYQAS